MNKQLDKKSQKMLLDALNSMKEMTKKMQEKHDLKTWSSITVPLDLSAGLERLTKDELSNIRIRLEIQRASHLKKGDLIRLLETKIPELLEGTIINMDLERLKLLQKIVHNGGIISESSLEHEQIKYLRSRGILFPGTYEDRKILVMPTEVVNNLSHIVDNSRLESICKRNSEWIKLTQGMLYYYGTLTINELLQLLEKYTNQKVDLRNYLTVMEDARVYYDQFKNDQIGFSNYRVFDPKQVKQEHKMRSNLSFYPFSKDQLLKAGEPGYVERNDSFIRFVHYLTQNYEISRQDADTIVKECVYATNIGEGPNNVFQFLQERLEFDCLESVQECMDIAVDLMNHTRQQFLKGYFPLELSANRKKSPDPMPSSKNNVIDFQKKIGRNSPCPCGSNKKYKQCCGK
jgi:hypothetical protein